MRKIKVGDKVHVKVKTHNKVIAEWDGVVVLDCSYFGDKSNYKKVTTV